MTNDHKHAIKELERDAQSIWMLLEGLSHSAGVNEFMLRAAKDAMQDMIGFAKKAVNHEQT